MKLISFNVRGLGGGFKKREVKEMVKSQSPYMCIQESKLEEVDRKLVSWLWEGDDFEWVAKNAVSRSGGLISIWRKGSFSLNTVFQGDHLIGLVGNWGAEQVPVTILNIYAPCDLRGKKQLWEEIANQKEVRGL